MGVVTSILPTVRYHPFILHFGGLPLKTGDMLQLLTLDLWSRRPKLSTNQVVSLGFLWPWNGVRLKNSKKKNRVCAIWSFFLISYHIWVKEKV